MTNLSKIQITSISKSSSKEIANKIESVLLKLKLRLLLVLTLIYLKYILVSNVVVNEYLVWSANTRMVLNLYPLHRGCVWEVSGV